MSAGHQACAVKWPLLPEKAWEGSMITWDLTPISKGTRLLFGQHDLMVGATGHSIEETRAGWAYFLLGLKSCLVTGKGTPYVY